MTATANHEDMQGRVRAILIENEAFLDAEETAQVDELLDANEYGIALEMLCELLDEKGAVLPGERANAVAELGRKMNLDKVLRLAAGLQDEA